ncbi:HAD family hydrolase [Spirochaeta cellobiosiphila]|uniref:HAD family hydrolase n=1 Tax=Spirochaeta cellobiosiphila TaxID=504483 RepID=UPI0003FBF0E0|nr:HAD family hydrolase [Spirochaeta cellobiosiphila]
MKIEAVAFDIDGTLYPNSEMYLKSIPFVMGHLRELKTFSKVRKDIRDHKQFVDFHQQQAIMMGEALGISPERAKALINRVFYTRWFKVFNHLKPFPHVKEVLESFKSKGLKLAALSDFPLQDRLNKLGLDEYFPVKLSSEDVGRLKPNVEPFVELQKRLEIPAENILYVGNSYQYDVEGSHKANMKAAHLVKRPKKQSEAEFSFYNYHELEKWVLGQLQ